MLKQKKHFAMVSFCRLAALTLNMQIIIFLVEVVNILLLLPQQN